MRFKREKKLKCRNLEIGVIEGRAVVVLCVPTEVVAGVDEWLVELFAERSVKADACQQVHGVACDLDITDSAKGLNIAIVGK
jgi:hypothetical protein